MVLYRDSAIADQYVLLIVDTLYSEYVYMSVSWWTRRIHHFEHSNTENHRHIGERWKTFGLNLSFIIHFI